MTHVFDSIESAHEYVGLLLEAIQDTASEVGEDLRQPKGAASQEQREAFRLIAYKLEQLRFHVEASHRRLNDLRTLHRMLDEESSVILAD